MNLIKLSFSYLRRRALNTLLNILLFSFGIATITILLLFSYQLEDNLYKNAEGIDVVVGAKGSPRIRRCSPLSTCKSGRFTSVPEL